MGEAIFVGSKQPDINSKLDIDQLKIYIVQKWNDATIEIFPEAKISLQWSVLSPNWYLECDLIREDTLSIRSNKGEVVADVILWFFNFNPNRELIVYSANNVTNPLELSINVSKIDLTNWIKQS